MKQIQQSQQAPPSQAHHPPSAPHPVTNGSEPGGADLKTQILAMEEGNLMKYSGHPPTQNGQAVSTQQSGIAAAHSPLSQHPPPGSTTNLGDLNNLLHEGSSMIY